ncbi:MAG: PA2779 family protein [Sideroxydans sp.]|nr:PA2779 family protein [Sideroxydans sp.]
MNTRFMRMTSRLLIATVLALVLPVQSAYAGIVTTDKVAASAQADSSRERIRSYLNRDDVRAELKKQGIDAAAADARVSALSDDEVQQLSGKLDKLPAGGDIIGTLFTVFVILLVTDILGFTKVFPFTRSIKH